jgi:hypothetical protein
MTKADILRDAAVHREQEVLHHQINIDNYRLAIAEIEQNHVGVAHMEEFGARLRDLLTSSIHEQDKEKVLLKVVKAQLGELECISA